MKLARQCLLHLGRFLRQTLAALNIISQQVLTTVLLLHQPIIYQL
jgi:hypothetical protein